MLIELYIGTTGRTGNAMCTNATGPQGDVRAILYDGNIEYEIRGVLTKYTSCGLKKTISLFKLFRGVCLIRFNRV